MSRNFARCNICNKVAKEEIADEDNHYPGAFSYDPDGYGYLCYDCSSSIASVRTEWEMEEDIDDS